MKPTDCSDATTPTREPLHIEVIAGTRALQTALDMPKPWPHTHYDDLAADQRRIESEALADPLRDHIPQAAQQRKVRGVLRILDQLESETLDRRFTH